MPAVSVVLPTFNRTGYLKRAVDSAHAQTFADWEMIIADDGSGEETRSYLRGLTDPRVRTLLQPHCGNPSVVRNLAIEVATGRYLAFLDSDDVWAPSKLEKQVEAMRQHPRARWSYTGLDRIDENGRGVPEVPVECQPLLDGWIFEPLLTLDLCVAMPTVMADRDLVNEVGRFDERQRFGEFHELCVRLAMRSEVVSVREALCSIRRHSEHYSADRIAAVESWIALHGKLAALAPNARVRSRCLRRRADESIKLAGLHATRRDLLRLAATLAGAAPWAWRYSGWWLGALKNVTRAVVPQALLTAYRRRHETRMT
jgi:glycosyltransferase involved in cell wall biosynthesis